MNEPAPNIPPDIAAELDRRLVLHDAFTRAIQEAEASQNGTTVEDVLAALSSCALAIIAQAPQGTYAKFLQDLAVMWQEGRRKLQEAQAAGVVR